MKKSGKMKYANGDLYVGLWDEDGLKSEGVMKYNDGRKFEGEFKEGIRKCGWHYHGMP